MFELYVEDDFFIVLKDNVELSLFETYDEAEKFIDNSSE